MEVIIKTWNNDDQCQPCHESMQWLGLNCAETQELCFQTKHVIIQKCINFHGAKVKEHAMKEIKKLATKNEFFG